MKVAILGFGEQNRSAYEYWSSQPNVEIVVVDSNEKLDLPKNVTTKLGKNFLSNLDQYDLIVRSPIIHPNQVIALNPKSILEKITTNTNEFLRVCPTRNIIAVTGTKGKGTTSTLITKLLEASGKTVHLGGNIGIPPLNLLKENIRADDWVVLELANFQLIDLKHSPKIGVCLIVVPEHLDWHLDMDDYVGAKQKLFAHQKVDDIAIYYAKSELSKKVVSVSQGLKIPYLEKPGALVQEGNIVINDQVICKTTDLQLPGSHNWQNVCAAVTAVWQVTQNTDIISSVLKSFKSLPFRIQLIKEKDGVTYYNDSFASAPDATVAALSAVDGMKVIIVGGFDRHLPLRELSQSIKEDESNIRKVVLIGASGKRIANALNDVGYSNYLLTEVKTMKEVVNAALTTSKSGDSIILSPGFPSFDMFKNFEDRGIQFNDVVKSL